MADRFDADVLVTHPDYRRERPHQPIGIFQLLDEAADLADLRGPVGIDLGARLTHFQHHGAADEPQATQ